MKEKILLSILFILTFFSGLFAESIGGFWKSIDEESGKARSLVAVYEYEGKYYGRIIGTFDDNGNKIDETIYSPKSRAPGVVGDPYYCGLDFIWDLKPKGYKYKGKIMDPREGKVYTAELWVADDKLIVRGELFIFGRNQTWLLAEDRDYPKGFKLPDVSTFVPVIPEIKQKDLE